MNQVQPKHNQTYEITRNLLQFGLVKKLPFQGILKNLLNRAIGRRVFRHIHLTNKTTNTFLYPLDKALVSNGKIYGPGVIYC